MTGPRARVTYTCTHPRVLVRRPLYDTKASKQTVSLTINGELYARAKKLELNVSQIAEQALAEAVQHLDAEQVKADIRDDLAAIAAYEQKHGSFVEMMREYLEERSRRAAGRSR